MREKRCTVGRVRKTLKEMPSVRERDAEQQRWRHAANLKESSNKREVIKEEGQRRLAAMEVAEFVGGAVALGEDSAGVVVEQAEGRWNVSPTREKCGRRR